MKNNIAIKSVILAVAIAVAIGGVLFFIKTIVSPPDDVKKVNVHEQNITQEITSYKPDTLSLEEAEKEYHRIIDKANIYHRDSLISDTPFNTAIGTTTEKFAVAFTNWAFSVFSQSQWNAGDLQTMNRLIGLLRQVTIDSGSKKALQAGSSSKLTEIEGIIQKYHAAWNVAIQTHFVSYESTHSVVREAKQYANTQYLQNCASLCYALSEVGTKLEHSRYWQLHARVGRLKHLNNFVSKDAYESESTIIYDLIKEFKESTVFGVSTASDAETLANMQDDYDRNANNYDWQNLEQENE